jgi:hypothetical protein
MQKTGLGRFIDSRLSWAFNVINVYSESPEIVRLMEEDFASIFYHGMLIFLIPQRILQDLLMGNVAIG